MGIVKKASEPSPYRTPACDTAGDGRAARGSALARRCALALGAALACGPAPAASPPPDPSCERQALSAGPLRIDAWSCTLPTGRWHVRPEPALPGFALWIDEARRETVVHAVPRAPGAPLSAVVATLARAGHVPPDDCVFVRTHLPGLGRAARVYELRPTGVRLAALKATPLDQVPDPPCGEYGWSTHGVRGFVVDPRRPGWVVYVNLGQDGTLIDPATLAIGD